MAATRDLAGGDPPESTRLRIGDDIAWSDVGVGAVYDRDDSLKENTNPKCLLKNHHHATGGAASASQRFTAAASIIGISGKLGQGGGCGNRRTHHPPPAMFPRKSKTGGGGRNPKPAVPEHEPESPKVSCIGKVLSDRERARRFRPPRLPEVRPPGCCPGFGSLMIRRSRSRNSAVECVDQSPPQPAVPRSREVKVEEEEAAPAPGLGGVRRFASGRRAAEWAVQMEVDGSVAQSGPL